MWQWQEIQTMLRPLGRLYRPMKSFQRLTLTLTFLVGLNVSVWAQKPLKVEAGGIQIVAKQESEEFDSLRPFHQQLGTKVALMIHGEGLIAIDTNESKLSAFRDNKGTNLLVKEGFGGDGFDSFPKVNDAGTLGMVDVRGGGIPTKGAHSVQVKGSLTVSQGTQSKAVKSAKVAFKDGSKLVAGAYTFEIKKVGKPSFGDHPMEITLKIDQKLTEIRAFRFLDVNGNEVESNGTGSSSMGFNDQVTVERSFSLAKEITTGTLELDVWQDLKTKTVPIDVTVGVGF